MFSVGRWGTNLNRNEIQATPIRTRDGIMKFLIYKGLEGWGDRIQVGLEAVRYARLTNRILVFDWRDSDWSGENGRVLESFLRFEGVQSFDLQSFLMYFEAYRDCLTVFPPAWTRFVTDGDYAHRARGDFFRWPMEDRPRSEILTLKAPDVEADVVVIPFGSRNFWWQDFRHIQLSELVRPALQDFFRQAGLRFGAYDAVHLRGGSKTWDRDRKINANLAKKIHEKFPTEQSYLDYLVQQVQAKRHEAPALPLRVVSDSRDLAQKFIDLMPGARFVGQSFHGDIPGSGIHKASPVRLRAVGLSRYDINIEMLRDFAVLLNAREVYSDDISIFSSTAKRIPKSVLGNWRFDD